MTDNTQIPSNTSDPTLVLLVALINKADLEMGLTVSSNGVVLSGQAISYAKYNREMAEQMRGAAGNADLASTFAEIYETREREAQEQAATDPEEDPALLPNYLHLRLRVLPQTLLPIEAGGNSDCLLWRCSLTSVDGYALGVRS
jgi:hypothetical protein